MLCFIFLSSGPKPIFIDSSYTSNASNVPRNKAYFIDHLKNSKIFSIVKLNLNVFYLLAVFSVHFRCYRALKLYVLYTTSLESSTFEISTRKMVHMYFNQKLRMLNIWLSLR